MSIRISVDDGNSRGVMPSPDICMLLPDTSFQDSMMVWCGCDDNWILTQRGSILQSQAERDGLRVVSAPTAMELMDGIRGDVFVDKTDGVYHCTSVMRGTKSRILSVDERCTTLCEVLIRMYVKQSAF